MFRYVVKRLLALIPIVLGVVFIVQLIFYFSPTDPTVVILGNDYIPESSAELKAVLGLDRPFIEQYFSYIWDLIRLDFGESFLSGEPVVSQLAVRFPNTLILNLVSVAMCVIIAIPIGIQSAVKPNSLLSNTSSALGMVGVSMPTFWVGLMLMLLFSVKLGWLPSVSDMSIKGIIMPSITLALNFIASNMRTTRSAMLDCLNADYIRTARAKGVSNFNTIYKHALGNARLPIITVIGMNISTQMGGSVITESVFSFPGLGIMMTNGINQKDTPVILGSLVVMAISVGICNLLVDLLFAFVDPRIKSQYKKKG
jgi:peptide/nickel transport system permease protein